MDSAVQVSVAMAIPFVVYLIRNKGVKGFFKSIGLFWPKEAGAWKTLGIWLLLTLGLMIIPIVIIAKADINSASGLAHDPIRAEGFTLVAMGMLFMKSMVQTSLSEEILFRGFIGKGLINVMGFKYGNIVQALIFGSIHGFAILQFGVVKGMFLVLSACLAGWIYGYLMEKKANGSMMIGWLLHGTSNFVSFFIFSFLL